MPKRFVQTLDTNVYNVLCIVAEERGVSIEQFLRTIIIPEWMCLAVTNSPGRIPSGTYQD